MLSVNLWFLVQKAEFLGVFINGKVCSGVQILQVHPKSICDAHRVKIYDKEGKEKRSDTKFYYTTDVQIKFMSSYSF